MPDASEREYTHVPRFEKDEALCAPSEPPTPPEKPEVAAFQIPPETGLNHYAILCHGLAISAGWWADLQNVMTAHGLSPADKERIVAWYRATKLALAHSELSEALEGMRKGIPDDHLPYRSMLEVELADALIRVFDLAGHLKLDLDGAVREKLAYNAQRADHKPENRVKVGGKSF